MALLLDECEKNICSQLRKLEEFQNALKTALTAIENLRQIGDELSGTPEQMVKQLLVHNIKASSKKEESTLGHKPVVNGNNEHTVIQEKPPQLAQSTIQSQAAPSKPDILTNGVDSDSLITNLIVTAGPKVGVKYKVEVTSTLGIDGTFWACHVESGFIQDKLEPLSERLRACVQQDRKNWVVDDLSKLVCVKSVDNGLWMRAKVIKQNNEQSVRVRFVDIGGTEDCQKSRLSKVPDDLAVIPFMAFNCTLAEEVVKLQYETKWKFNDLSKKKILNFTVLKIVQRGDESFAYGRLETILDNPPININEIIVPNSPSFTKKEKSAITSRDIRVQGGAAKEEGLVAVTEIIRNTSVGATEDAKSPGVSTESSAVQPSAKKAPSNPQIPPIQIPDPSSSTTTAGELDWGDSQTPEADGYVPLSPLDESIFDSPTNSMTEKQLNEQFHNAAVRRRSSELANNYGPVEQHTDATASANPLLFNEDFIKDNLSQLYQHQEKLLRNPPSSETQQLLSLVQQNIASFTQLLNERQQQQKPVQSPSYFQSQPPPSAAAAQIALLLAQTQQNSSSMPAYSNLLTQQQQQLPIGTRQPLQQQQQQQQMRQQPVVALGLSHLSSLLQQQQTLGGVLREPTTIDNADYLVKMKQLSDISRCLKTPSGMLDEQQIQQLQITKNRLEKQLQEEEIRKGQMEAMLGIQETSPPSQPRNETSISAASIVPTTSTVNEILMTSQLEQQQKLAQLREEHVRQGATPNNGAKTNLLVQKEQKTVVPAEERLSGDSSKTTTQSTPATAAGQPTLKSTGQVAAAKSNRPPQVSNDGTIEITHTSQMDNKPKFRNFVVPPYDTLLTESRDDWIARELLNLEHSYLTDPKARFFSVVSLEVGPGRFLPNLAVAYQRNSFLLLDNDAKPFQKEWARVDGPVFLLIKHKPCQVGVPWKIGGICQVVSNVQALKNLQATSKFRFQCKINVVSTAVVEGEVRSNQVTREICPDSMRRLIHKLVIALQEGTCTNMFEYQEQTTKNAKRYEQEHPAHHCDRASQQYHSATDIAPNTFSGVEQNKTNSQTLCSPLPPHILTKEEDWDLELESTMKQSLASSEDIASGDECERDLNAEREAFGLNQDDF